jgi:hypothetical protein
MVGDAVAIELGLHHVEQLGADDGFVLAEMGDAFVNRLSDVDAVANDVARRWHREELKCRPPARADAGRCAPRWDGTFS